MVLVYKTQKYRYCDMKEVKYMFLLKFRIRKLERFLFLTCLSVGEDAGIVSLEGVL
jgi:hypothetical protein